MTVEIAKKYADKVVIHTQTYRQTIAEGQRQGVFRQDLKPIVCAKILYGALDEMVTNWILSKKSYPLAPMADEVLKVFFNGTKISEQ